MSDVRHATRRRDLLTDSPNRGKALAFENGSGIG